MTFSPTYDLQDSQISPQERYKAFLLKLIQRKQSIMPNKADGFLTTNTTADSDAEGAPLTTSQT